MAGCGTLSFKGSDDALCLATWLNESDVYASPVAVETQKLPG